MALRMQADPLMVIQNLYVVHGKPGWSSQFLIATFNQCGRFSSIRFEFAGKENADTWRCRAAATELSTSQEIRGSWVSIAMAKTEGWYGKTGSKWKTMPQQMLMYRAASFFVRAFAPEIAMGLPTGEELHDMSLPTATATSHGVTALQAKLAARQAAAERAEPELEPFDERSLAEIAAAAAEQLTWSQRLKNCESTEDLQTLRDAAIAAMASEDWDEKKIDQWESACQAKFNKLSDI